MWKITQASLAKPASSAALSSSSSSCPVLPSLTVTSSAPLHVSELSIVLQGPAQIAFLLGRSSRLGLLKSTLPSRNSSSLLVITLGPPSDCSPVTCKLSWTVTVTSGAPPVTSQPLAQCLLALMRVLLLFWLRGHSIYICRGWQRVGSSSVFAFLCGKVVLGLWCVYLV